MKEFRCLLGDNEMFTNNGVKRIENLTKDFKIYSYDPKTKQIKLNNVIAVIGRKDTEEFDNAEMIIETLYSENIRLKEEIEQLKTKLEKELEWKPCDTNDYITQSKYEMLLRDSETHFLTDEEAKNILYVRFGLPKDKIEIVNNVKIYEINRHNQIRKTRIVKRYPIYNDTDNNYIRFDYDKTSYELYNNQIRLFVD